MTAIHEALPTGRFMASANRRTSLTNVSISSGDQSENVARKKRSRAASTRSVIALPAAVMAAARTRLTEYSPEISEGMAHVEGVSRALSTFDAEVRKTINEAGELDDADTADLFTEISRGIDKWLWFVEAHSQAAK